MAETIEVDSNIEAQIAQSLGEIQENPDLYGLAVSVERINTLAPGIARTALPKGCYPEEQDVISLRPLISAKGSIFAIDNEHNTLWLRPQRLTISATDSGFLAVAGFIQDGHPAYSVTVRSPTWRDGIPLNIAAFGPSPYARPILPNLLEKDWTKLKTS
ncbi:MAG TPA: hypothetical protein VIH90_07860 [Candidatus Saccharimonadales bacterium]